MLQQSVNQDLKQQDCKKKKKKKYLPHLFILNLLQPLIIFHSCPSSLLNSKCSETQHIKYKTLLLQLKYIEYLLKTKCFARH
jgi:hypothetical protein